MRYGESGNRALGEILRLEDGGGGGSGTFLEPDTGSGNLLGLGSGRGGGGGGGGLVGVSSLYNRLREDHSVAVLLEGGGDLFGSVLIGGGLVEIAEGTSASSSSSEN